VRCDHLHERAALAMRLADETDVAETQVPKSAVDELRGRARGLGAEVGALDERHPESGPSRFACYPGADDPPADDQEIEGTLAELLESRGSV